MGTSSRLEEDAAAVNAPPGPPLLPPQPMLILLSMTSPMASYISRRRLLGRPLSFLSALPIAQ
jgi:hypothetical protein